jgi:lysozyme family protein
MPGIGTIAKYIVKYWNKIASAVKSKLSAIDYAALAAAVKKGASAVASWLWRNISKVAILWEILKAIIGL